MLCDNCRRNKAFIPQYDNHKDVELCEMCFKRHMINTKTNLDISRKSLFFKNNEANQSINENQLDLKQTQLTKIETLKLDSGLNCGICFIEFSFLKTKQTCMNCGIFVCSECSRRKFLLPYVNPEKESRVCGNCYFF